jgi:hypothetical protein
MYYIGRMDERRHPAGIGDDPRLVRGVPAFGSHQLKRLGRMLEMARELTADFFGLTEDQARDVPCEIRTLAELKQDEIHADRVLADLARYQYIDAEFGRKHDLYRVNVQDHNILHSVQRNRSDVRLAPLLLYVLTHELVHVIRFIKFLAPFHLPVSERWGEERRVHELTLRILSAVPMPGLTAVLSRYHSLTTGGSEGGSRSGRADAGIPRLS